MSGSWNEPREEVLSASSPSSSSQMDHMSGAAAGSAAGASSSMGPVYRFPDPAGSAAGSAAGHVSDKRPIVSPRVFNFYELSPNLEVRCSTINNLYRSCTTLVCAHQICAVFLKWKNYDFKI